MDTRVPDPDSRETERTGAANSASESPDEPPDEPPVDPPEQRPSNHEDDAERVRLRKEIEHLREENENLRNDATRYRSLVDLTTDAAYDLIVSDADGNAPHFALTWASGSFSRLIGISHGRLMAGQDWIEHVHPADRSLLHRHREHLASGSRMVTEYRIQTSSARDRWVCDYGQPVHGSAGVRRVHGALREVTHARHYDRAMRANRIKYKHIFNQSPLGILHFDAESCITQCNDNLVRIVGSSRNDLVGLNMIEDLEDEALIRAIIEALEHGSGTYEGDYASVIADKVTPVRVLFNSIRSEAGDVLGGVGIVEDITERRRYEQELIRARDEAETMNRLKSAFLANMSHEIRTPLTAIIGFADILTDELPVSHRRIPQLIEQSGKRLLDTLNSVLDLSMLESGEMELNRALIDVAQHVEDHVDLMHPLSDNKGLDLDVARPDRPCYARLDEGALDRILSNLIGNAIKFTDEGHVTVTVRQVLLPRAAEAPKQVDRPRETDMVGLRAGVAIQVSDTGVGISEEFLPHLFDVFKQESAGLKRTHEGSGLGLAITKHLVDELDGTIEVSSQKNEGSTFVVTFPAVHDTAGEQPEPRPGLQRHRPGRRILVVEDTPETQVLVERILEPHHDIDIVATTEEAIAAARQHRPVGETPYDLILMDIHLEGGGSGLDLLPEVRSLPNYAGTPIVAMTAFALSGDRQRFLEAGFDAYLGKPFTADQLLAVIDQALAANG